MMYFISYDVANPKRLIKVAKTLENFGIRIQYSFFECEMGKSRLDELKSSLFEVMNLKEDSLRIYPLCENCLKETSTVGNGTIFVPQSFMIL